MAALWDLATTWGSFYANHAALRTVVTFAHVGSLVVGGGAAIAADRATLGAPRADGAARGAQLDALQNTHRLVVCSLALVVLSGIAMFAADVDTFLHSRVFWIKMAVVVLLMVNGALLYRAETRVRNGEAAAWKTVHGAALASVSLWLLATLAGVALMNIG
jgi:uncharacterized membrane protein